MLAAASATYMEPESARADSTKTGTERGPPAEILVGKRRSKKRMGHCRSHPCSSQIVCNMFERDKVEENDASRFNAT